MPGLPQLTGKARRIAIGVIVAVVFGGLGAGMALTLSRTPETVTVPTTPEGLALPSDASDPAVEDLEAAREDLDAAGEDLDAATEELNAATEELAVKLLASLLQVHLGFQDAEGLLVTLCEADADGNRVRSELMSIPFLDPSSPEYARGVTFSKPTIKPTDEGYVIAFSGTYGNTGEPIDITFRANVHGFSANWCGVEGRW
ncbi:hypothetical protein K1T35_19070 [Pseudonocardia sp. DSM 110487]|uniref:hypothetical protein n=1 Tax=Pseudonocardia sp. DSM 110487 TaxID=2865833 RepID=UPI001C6A18D9|nr:hypothetical protein [Pseudonocardia sp. DSM 110487]QYN39108.1 hypothetical protein K1T35_19070 [Pseudonocardia sp. DSM 110487]